MRRPGPRGQTALTESTGHRDRFQRATTASGGCSRGGGGTGGIWATVRPPRPLRPGRCDKAIPTGAGNGLGERPAGGQRTPAHRVSVGAATDAGPVADSPSVMTGAAGGRSQQGVARCRPLLSPPPLSQLPPPPHDAPLTVDLGGGTMRPVGPRAPCLSHGTLTSPGGNGRTWGRCNDNGTGAVSEPPADHDRRDKTVVWLSGKFSKVITFQCKHLSL